MAAKRRMRRRTVNCNSGTRRKTPLNIMAIFSAVGSQRLASKLSPRAPRQISKSNTEQPAVHRRNARARRPPRTPTYGDLSKAEAGALAARLRVSRLGLLLHYSVICSRIIPKPQSCGLWQLPDSRRPQTLSMGCRTGSNTILTGTRCTIL